MLINTESKEKLLRRFDLRLLIWEDMDSREPEAIGNAALVTSKIISQLEYHSPLQAGTLPSPWHAKADHNLCLICTKNSFVWLTLDFSFLFYFCCRLTVMIYF